MINEARDLTFLLANKFSGPVVVYKYTFPISDHLMAEMKSRGFLTEFSARYQGIWERSMSSRLRPGGGMLEVFSDMLFLASERGNK